MNVRYDAPNDELVLDLRVPGGSQSVAGSTPCVVQADVDADGHVLAFRIAGAVAKLGGEAVADIEEVLMADEKDKYRGASREDVPTFEELARLQGVRPTPISEIAGKWPGDPNDDFDEFIRELRISQGGVNLGSRGGANV